MWNATEQIWGTVHTLYMHNVHVHMYIYNVIVIYLSILHKFEIGSALYKEASLVSGVLIERFYCIYAYYNELVYTSL